MANNQYTISGTPLNNFDVAPNNTSGISRSGWVTITTSATPTGIIPGMTVVIAGNATAAFNAAYVVSNVNYTQNQFSIQTATAPGAGGTVYYLPQGKQTFIALCTAQPLDNNYLQTTGAPGTLQIQEYAATGYSRQSISWSAATGPNSGTGTVFVGTGASALINGSSATAAPTFSPGLSTNLTVTNIVVSGSTGNPPFVATVTTSANQGVAVGDNVTIGGSWTGGTGTINGGTYTVTSVPSNTTFTIGTNQTTIVGNATSPTANGTFTGGTVLLNGPYNVTFTTYNTAVGTGTPVLANHGLVIGSTINVTGTTVSAGVLDQVNGTVVATPTTSTFTVASQLTGTPASTTNVSIAASGTTVYPGSYFTNGTTAIPATGFVTYIASNAFRAGDTVIISGATGVTGYNRTTQVFASNAGAFVVFDPTTGAPGGTISVARVGAVSVGGLIQGPTAGSLTFGAFTAGTGATVTHAALVSTPTANSTIAIGQVAASTPAAGFVRFTTAAAHGLSAGHQVYINGITPLGYNGLYTVLAASSTTTFDVANSTTGASTTAGTVSGIQNGELLAWWGLDTPRTPAVNDQVTIGTNQLSLYVN
ncbi:MAG: hypothetical protein EBU01_08895 [Crocinitomicaceae bacterium]|nr:hypothetical protein [Crocinitomicaceae bacterium]